MPASPSAKKYLRAALTHLLLGVCHIHRFLVYILQPGCMQCLFFYLPSPFLTSSRVNIVFPPMVQSLTPYTTLNSPKQSIVFLDY